MANVFKLEDFPNTHEELLVIKRTQETMAARLNLPLFKAYPVGSFETSDEDFNDVDILVYTQNYDPSFYLGNRGWQLDPEYENGRSFKKIVDQRHTTNLIWINDWNMFNKFYKAANLCKHLNLTNKEHRILVHEMFIKGKLPKTIDELQV